MSILLSIASTIMFAAAGAYVHDRRFVTAGLMAFAGVAIILGSLTP